MYSTRIYQVCILTCPVSEVADAEFSHTDTVSVLKESLLFKIIGNSDSGFKFSIDKQTTFPLFSLNVLLITSIENYF